jgi:hypothetical protein
MIGGEGRWWQGFGRGGERGEYLLAYRVGMRQNDISFTSGRARENSHGSIDSRKNKAE